jgi:hypothetical protein
MPIDDVINRTSSFFSLWNDENCFVILSIVFNRDVEKDINAHVLGKDFRRMLISAAQVK